ncbi:hypothetical protein [Actinoallomurus acanthiterrae]
MPRPVDVPARSTQSASSSRRGGAANLPRLMASASTVESRNGAASTIPIASAASTVP